MDEQAQPAVAPTAPHRLRALLIEDDEDVARTVCEHLRGQDIAIDHARTIAQGWECLHAVGYAALILDLILPDGDGLDLLARLRTEGHDLPVIVLTSRDGIHDRLTGFKRGADDYLCKPFDVMELAARLEAIARRASAGERHVLRYADLRLDLLSRVVSRGVLEAALSGREASLLAFFLRHPDEIISRDRLLEAVWGEEVEDDSNLVNVYVNLLRNKIESPSAPRLIQTVRGVGYVLSAQPADLLS